MAAVQIRPYTAHDEPAWNAFVDTRTEASFFHAAAWRDIFETALGHRTHYLIAEQDGAIAGVLPLVHVRSLLFGNSLSSLAFCSDAGALATTPPVARALEQAAVALAHRLKVGAVEFRYRQPSGVPRPTKDLYETFAKPLAPDAESNMQAIRSKQRNIIRKGIKNGLESRVDNVENFYRAYAESVRNLGTPVFPKQLFSAIHQRFPQQTEFFSAYHENRIISSAMNFYFRDQVCPYYWGGVRAARQLNGNDFLCWEIMNRAAARGCTSFDFGRSKKDTGAYQWKENLGFVAVPLHYEYELIRAHEVPNINPLNPKYRLFVEAWKRLPLPVSQWLGPMLARSLG